MEQDKHITEVIFRVDKTKGFEGEVFAILPYCKADNNGNVTVYQHIGQHSAGKYAHMIATSRLATSEQYADLKKEMEGLGYNFKVIYKKNLNKKVE